MKKTLCCLLIACILLFSASALADVPNLSEKTFKYAKSAIKSLAAGDYNAVVTSLPFSDISPSADEWRNFAEGSFSSLSGSNPQTKYAVAYWTGHAWKIAVPVSEPSGSGVETLVLISEDGRSFTGYGCSSWGSIEDELRSTNYVIWNDEYHGSTSVIVEPDA